MVDFVDFVDFFGRSGWEGQQADGDVSNNKAIYLPCSYGNDGAEGKDKFSSYMLFPAPGL